MAFVTLNGLYVPIEADSVTVDRQLIGEKERAFDGTMLEDRRAFKRTWTLSTCPLTCAEAEQIKRFIEDNRIKGITWEDDTDTVDGESPATATNVSRTDVATDGAAQVGQSKNGSRSFVSEFNDGAGNLLTSDSADAENAPTGYSTLVGGALSADTSKNFQGTQALRFRRSGLLQIEGFRTDGVAGVTDTELLGSVRVMTEIAATLNVSLYDETNAAQGTITSVTTEPNKWHHVHVGAVFAGGAKTVHLRVEQTEQQQPPDIWADAFTLSPSDSPMCNWYDGGSGPSEPELRYDPADLITTDAFTISQWVRLLAVGSSNLALRTASGHIWNIGASSNNIRLTVNDSGWQILTVMRYGSNVGGFTQASPRLDDNEWHMLTLVANANDSEGKTFRFYLDGQLEAAADAPTIPDVATDFYIGTATGGGAAVCPGYYDDLFVFGEALTATQVAKLYTSFGGIAEPPQMQMHGDLICNEAVTVLAQVTGDTVFGAGLNSTWETAARRLQLEIEEV